jgi:L-threonylcarbamoyladenylate synthase
MEILEPTGDNLRRAAELIARGGLVAFPTETVYGLGADAFDARAVARIFEAKARPSFDPLIVHVASALQVGRVAAWPSAAAKALAESLWPGPLTLVMPKLEAIPDIVTSGLPTVAVRLPAHPVAREIIALSGTAVAAPSANPFGYLSPTRAEHVARMLGEKVDLIVDGGQCAVGVESTVLDMTCDPPRILRPGGTSAEDIEAVIGPVARPGPGGAAAAAAPMAGPARSAFAGPGMLASHYAPRTPLRLVAEGALAAARPKGRAAALVLDPSRLESMGKAASRFAHTRVLTMSGDLVEAAAALFAALHELDQAGFDEIWAERVPDSGLGPAINDRLGRAAAKS